MNINACDNLKSISLDACKMERWEYIIIQPYKTNLYYSKGGFMVFTNAKFYSFNQTKFAW